MFFLLFEKNHGFDLKFFKQMSENILGIHQTLLGIFD